MAGSGMVPGSPRKILLATDLSSRCDRAFDRAVLLAREWNATLLLVHALEASEPSLTFRRGSDLPWWRRPSDPVRVVRERIRAELRDESPQVDIDVHVEIGRPADVVLSSAVREGGDLVVTGVARDESLARFLLGDTVDQLIRTTPVPVLIVRGRAYRPYRKVTVAIDFSPSSQLAFNVALSYFPEALLGLFHGYDIPFATYLADESIREEFERLGDAACDKFLAEADLPAERAIGIERIVARGVPEVLLRHHAEEHRADLIVVGSGGEGLLHKVFIGSTAAKIIDAVPSDVLLVRDLGAVAVTGDRLSPC